jgi:hypothetical protein|tara:strand:- start:838 stop:942 length:105 start_codon:yes stop_codon:yes gene_type:complete
MTKPNGFDWETAFEFMQWPIAFAVALLIALLIVR